MSEKPKGWLDLPAELKIMVVEKCDFITRCNMRISSVSLKSLVDVAKLFISSIKIKERTYGVRLEFGFDPLFSHVVKFVKDDENGARVQRRNKEDVLVANDPIDEALALLSRVCLRKEVTIGYLFLETLRDSDELTLSKKVRAMLEASAPRLSIRCLFWEMNGDSELGWVVLNHCQKNFLTDIKVYGCVDSPLALFEKGGDVVRNLNRVEVLAEVRASEEDVLSLTADRFHLNLESFTSEMMTKLLDKFIYEKPVGSFFIIKRRDEEPQPFKVPIDFNRIDSSERKIAAYSLPLLSGKLVSLRTGPYGVYAEIGTPAAFQDPNNTLQRDTCLKRKGCACLEPRFLPDDDSSEFDDFDEVDDDESFDFDDVLHHGGWSDNEILDESDYDYWEEEGELDDIEDE